MRRAEQAALPIAMRTERAEQQTAQALLTAQERLQFGRQAVDEMYTQVAEKWLAQQAELTQVQKQFLEKALAFYQRLATEESADPAVLFETAKAEQRVGEIQNKLGKHAEAEAAYRRAIELFAQLAREAQDAAKYNQVARQDAPLLGIAAVPHGPAPGGGAGTTARDHAVPGLGRSVPRRLPVPAGPRQEPRRTGAGAVWKRECGRGTGGFSPERCPCSAVADARSRRPRSEVPTGDCIRYTWPRIWRTGTLRRRRTSIAASRVAPPSWWRTIPGTQSIVISKPQSLRSWGGILPLLGRSPEAEAVLRQAVTIQEGLVRDFPQVPMHQDELAQALGNLGIVLNRLAKFEESEQVQRRSLEILEKLAAEYPEVPDYRSSVGAGLNNIANVLMDRGNWEEARQLLEQAIVHQKAALEINPRQTTTEFLSAHLIT